MSQSEMETFGVRVKRIREKMGLSQVELARRVGTTQPTVARWEDDKPPQGERLTRLARALETSAAYLMDGTEESEERADALLTLLRELSQERGRLNLEQVSRIAARAPEILAAIELAVGASLDSMTDEQREFLWDYLNILIQMQVRKRREADR